MCAWVSQRQGTASYIYKQRDLPFWSSLRRGPSTALEIVCICQPRGFFCLLVSFHLRVPSSFSQPFPFPVSPHLCGWPASPPLALRERQMLTPDPWFKGCLLSLLYRQYQNISGRAVSWSSSTPFCMNAPSLLCPFAARRLMAPVPFPIALPHSEAKWEPSIGSQKHHLYTKSGPLLWHPSPKAQLSLPQHQHYIHTQIPMCFLSSLNPLDSEEEVYTD